MPIRIDRIHLSTSNYRNHAGEATQLRADKHHGSHLIEQVIAVIASTICRRSIRIVELRYMLAMDFLFVCHVQSAGRRLGWVESY